MERVIYYLSFVADFLRVADEKISGAWRERNWPVFVKLWFVDSIAMALFGFLMPLVLGGVGLVIIRAYHFLRPKAAMSDVALSAYMSGMVSGLWNYAVVFGIITGCIALVTAIPIIGLKGGRRA